MSKKIIITGASGFLGKHLSERLNELGYDVIPLSSANGDICNSTTFTPFDNKDIAHVFHLAGNTFVPQSWKTPVDFIKTNVLGTTTVLDFCMKNKYGMTYVSAYIYGTEVVNPISEKAIPSPNNPYALSKKMGEDVCTFYAKFMNLNVNIVRPFNIYGGGQSGNFLIPHIIQQIKEGNIIKVKDLSPKRDYIHVKDVVECMIKAMLYKEYDVFNAGFGKSYSVEEVIECLFSITGKKLPIESENAIRINEISDTIADISNAKTKLNWVPKISLKEGLRGML